MKMKMKGMVGIVMIVLVICSQMEKVEPAADDCLDACETACVGKESKSSSY